MQNGEIKNRWKRRGPNNPDDRPINFQNLEYGINCSQKTWNVSGNLEYGTNIYKTHEMEFLIFWNFETWKIWIWELLKFENLKNWNLRISKLWFLFSCKGIPTPQHSDSHPCNSHKLPNNAILISKLVFVHSFSFFLLSRPSCQMKELFWYCFGSTKSKP